MKISALKDKRNIVCYNGKTIKLILNASKSTKKWELLNYKLEIVSIKISTKPWIHLKYLIWYAHRLFTSPICRKHGDNFWIWSTVCGWIQTADREHISEKFHARMGYSLVGRFHKSGYKFDTWYDMIWMEKTISVHCTNPPAVNTFPEIEKEAEKIY